MQGAQGFNYLVTGVGIGIIGCGIIGYGIWYELRQIATLLTEQKDQYKNRKYF